jgi:hypothetical protein
MLERLMGVFMLNANTFEEIEHDQTATSQAAIIVAAVAILSGIGSGIGASIGGNGSFIGSFIAAIIGAFLGWILWSAITYFVGTSLFGGQADMGEMLRVIGFAFAPQLLGIIPFIGACIGALWSLAAVFVAVRQGLDLDTGKTIMTIVIGFVVYLALFCGLIAILGGAGAAFGALSGG